MKSLLSTAYWPNLQYFYYVLNSNTLLIEQFENYQKQSFRNRITLLSANGPLNLSIPVQKKEPKQLTKNIEISYAENWQAKHWRAITSAYKNSPYFEHFESEIESLYSQQHEHLLAFNLLQIETVLRILKKEKKISLTTSYEKNKPNFIDLREMLHPKLDFKKDTATSEVLTMPYYQTFENKFEFVPNLTILDLVFNTGLGTLEYLSDKRRS